MSLMKTLAKVALGVALTKGASSMMKRGSSKSGTGTGGGLGGLLGGLSGSGARSTGGGSMQDMLGGLLGGSTTAGRGDFSRSGGSTGSAGAAGGLGGLLDALGGSRRGTGGSGGGLGGLLGGLASAAAAGGLLSNAPASAARRPEAETASFGRVLNSQFDSTPEPEIEPSREQEALAGLMLTAMIMAAKSDGEIDAEERATLLSELDRDDPEDMAFVEQQMQMPVDTERLIAETPEGYGAQIYTVSLLAIDLDNQAEAQHLDKLARGYGLSPDEVNQIHADLGVPSLYT